MKSIVADWEIFAYKGIQINRGIPSEDWKDFLIRMKLNGILITL